MSLEDALYPALRYYDRLPSSIKTAIGWSYRRLPSRIRYGASYRMFGDLAAAVEEWSPEEITTYQVEQLRSVLLHAARNCPFYRESFARAGFRPEMVRSLDDLRSCPYLEKSDLVGHIEDLAATDIAPSARLYMTTGGSTGSPVGFYLHKGISRPKEQAFLEAQWRRAGYFEGARLAVIRGHVTSTESRGRIATYDATRGWLMLSSYHLTAERLPEYLDAVIRFRPDIVHAYPSAALLLAEHLERSGLEWPVPLRCLLAGSERLTLPQKHLLERIFGCRVYTWYGHSERAVLAGEGRSSPLLHFCPAYGFVEFGPADELGLCEVIGTTFHSRAMPLIRYRTGDYVRVYAPGARDAREFPWPAAESVEGRQQEFLITASGRRISLTAFNLHDSTFDDVYAVQFFQEEAGKAELRYLPGPNFDRGRIPGMMNVVRSKLGDDLTVHLREVAEIEKTQRGKGRWLVSTVEHRGPAGSSNDRRAGELIRRGR